MDWGLMEWDGASDGCAESAAGGFDEGVEHALPDFVRWRVDAGGRQRVLLVRAEKGVDFWEGGFDFAELDVKDCDGAFGIAAHYEFAAGDSPVGGEPPKHDAAVEEFADGVEVLRRKAPVDDYRALEFFQGLDEWRRRCARVEQGVPGCRQAVAVEHPGFFHVEVEESFLLFEPPAEGGFPRSWDAGDEEVHGVSLASLGQARTAAGTYLYMIWKRDKGKIKKSSRKDKVARC